MQNRNGNYEKVLLGIAAFIGLAVAGFLIWSSQQLGDRLVRQNATSKNDPGQSSTAVVDDAIKRLTEKITWISPVINGKAVPLNKSVLLMMKGDQLFDLQLAEPVLRPPMTNAFLVENDLLNIEYSNVGSLDPDADGFTNLEEFNAKTDPKDATKHPPVTDKLFLKQRITHDYIVKLNSSSPPYQVQRTAPDPKKSVFVSPGDEFGFDKDAPRFKAISFEAKKIPDPSVGEKDVSELTVLDKSTNKEFKIARGTETNLAAYEAEFEFLLNGSVRTVKEGETFQIPGIGQTFKVLEIEDAQAVIQPIEEGSAKITVRKR